MILIKNNINQDSITIFSKKEEYNRNWISNSKKEEGEFGLKEELKNIATQSDISFRNQMIPDGHNEDELWEIFNIILDELEEGDEVILDITHSLRYLPMLTFIVINYARLVKGCNLKAIYYGAFDVLGPAYQVRELPLKERNAPIFDLTSFISLFDWTMAIDRYVGTGDASLVKKLTSTETGLINREIQDLAEPGSDKALIFRDPNALRALAKSMDNFSNVVATCRGPELMDAITSLKEDIDIVVENASHEKIKPMAPLMEMIESRFKSFSYDDEYANLIETARWCYENKMYQQGFTILHEGLIGYICEKWEFDKMDKEERKKVTSYIHNKDKDSDIRNYKGLGLSLKDEERLFKLIYDITGSRNDINHAGWGGNTTRINVLQNNLKYFIHRAETILVNKSNIEEETERKLLLVFSHSLTKEQEKEARKELGVSKILKLDKELSKKWANIPPQVEELDTYLRDFKEWLKVKGRAGDYILIQGDFGATYKLVNYCKKLGLIPVYSTTERQVKEEVGQDGNIVATRVFNHVRFREY